MFVKYFLWFLVLVIVAIIISTATAQFLFGKKVKAEVKELYKDSNVQKSEVVTRGLC